MHETDCVPLGDWVMVSDESEGKWKEAGVARREYTPWQLQAEKIEEIHEKVSTKISGETARDFFFRKYTFIFISVDKYNGYVGGSSLTWCVRKIVFECRICGNCCGPM